VSVPASGAVIVLLGCRRVIDTMSTAMMNRSAPVTPCVPTNSARCPDEKLRRVLVLRWTTRAKAVIVPRASAVWGVAKWKGKRIMSHLWWRPGSVGSTEWPPAKPVPEAGDWLGPLRSGVRTPHRGTSRRRVPHALAHPGFFDQVISMSYRTLCGTRGKRRRGSLDVLQSPPS